jgi:NAD-dependent deacetylase
MDVASLWAFHAHPERFYDWIRGFASKIRTAKPNPAHDVLARMEGAGLLRTVITQNVDSLHQIAGNRSVLELHGNTRTATCLECHARMSAESLWRAVTAGRMPEPCPQCGGLIKPDVILFGEPLPYDLLSAAQQEALNCEVMLVIGSSLEVMPAADLPLLAKRRGAHPILINLTPTPLDHDLEVVVREDVVKALQQIGRALLG